jgi:PAS domain S-box-containing protein
MQLDAFYRRFIESHPYPILCLDQSGKLLYANPASIPILLEWGIDVNETVKSDILEIIDKVRADNGIARLEVAHGQTIVELTFSYDQESDLVNVSGQDVTLQKYAQAELKKSLVKAEEIKASLEQAEVIGKHGSWELDLATRNASWSRGLFAVFGLEVSATAPTLEEFFELVDPRYRQYLESKIKNASADRSKNLQTNYAITLKDGTRKRLRGTSRVIVNEKGVPQRIVGTTQDVTDLVNAQEEAKAYKSALDQAAAVAITDPHGTITHANDIFSKFSGYPVDFLVGKNHRILKSGVMPDDFYKNMWQTISSGNVWKGEICNKAKDGRFYWVDTVIVPFIGTGDTPEKYLAIRTDITQRKKAEEESARAKEAALSALRRLEEAEIVGKFGSWEWHLNDRSFHCSKGLRQILGDQSSKTSPYDSFMKSLFPEDRKILEQSMESAIVSQLAFSCEFRLNPNAGRFTWLRTEGQPIFDALGKVQKIVGTIQDVTERTLSDIELTQATIRADAATRAKADFLANMSHEIRTPMNGVIGMCNLLLTSINDPKQKEQLKIIQNCGNSLLDLINDILDFSKLEAGKIELENEPFHIHEVAQEIVQLMNARASEKGILLSYVPAPSVPAWFLGDATRFRQILTNLVSNAIKFTERGSVTIRSSLVKLEEGQHEIQLSVTDTGVGIPDTVKSKLFNSFSQADASTTRKFGGTGLGLAISKGLCEKMGGKIWLESTVGKGTTFFFTMTLSETHAREVVPGILSLGIDPTMASKLPLRILVAEDNRVNQLVAVGLLEKLGYRPDVAANGHEVLSNLKQKWYDVIFMDFHMPEMDGLEATKKICEKYPEEKRPFIVALTASAMKEDVERCFAAGMKDFVSKPVQIKELVRVLFLLESNPSTDVLPTITRVVSSDSTSAAENEVTFDRKAFLENFVGLDDVLNDAIDSFLSLKSSLLQNVKMALDARDSKGLELAAHTLKGAVSNFFCEPAKTLASELEKKGNRGDFEGTQEIYDQLCLTIEELSRTLRELNKKVA